MHNLSYSYKGRVIRVCYVEGLPGHSDKWHAQVRGTDIQCWASSSDAAAIKAERDVDLVDALQSTKA